jgi:hypothetical protein
MVFQGFFCFGLHGRTATYPPTSTSLRAWGRRFSMHWSWTCRAFESLPPTDKGDMSGALIDHLSAGSVCDRAMYLAAHLVLDRGHEHRAGRPRGAWPRWCTMAALICGDRRKAPCVPGSTMVLTWPLVGTAVCRGLPTAVGVKDLSEVTSAVARRADASALCQTAGVRRPSSGSGDALAAGLGLETVVVVARVRDRSCRRLGFRSLLAGCYAGAAVIP